MNLSMLEHLFCRKYSTELLKFVPKHKPVVNKDVEVLRDFIQRSDKIAILTGAGISTESGRRAHTIKFITIAQRKWVYTLAQITNPSNIRVLKITEILGKELCWVAHVSKRQPNDVHSSIRNLEHDHCKVSSVITQNIDGLHFKAGSRNVIELHGTAFRVVCLQCHANYDRFYIQTS
nr:unnamed protein product [Callosobruchus analis]